MSNREDIIDKIRTLQSMKAKLKVYRDAVSVRGNVPVKVKKPTIEKKAYN